MTVQDQATHPEVADLGDFTAAWQGWHAGQEARLADPHAFLAITSLHWLTETPQRFGDAAGAWHTGPDGVTVELADGEELVIGGAAVRGRYSFGVIPELGGVNAGWGDAVIEVAKRGGHDIVACASRLSHRHAHLPGQERGWLWRAVINGTLAISAVRRTGDQFTMWSPGLLNICGPGGATRWTF